MKIGWDPFHAILVIAILWFFFVYPAIIAVQYLLQRRRRDKRRPGYIDLRRKNGSSDRDDRPRFHR